MESIIERFKKTLWIGKAKGELFDFSAKEDIEVNKGSILLRKDIQVKGPLVKARILICGLGLYELHINGKRVGDCILTPLVTAYSKRILYDSYDVTSLINPGKNTLGIELGNGWFTTQKKYWDWRMFWHGNLRAACLLEVVYADASKEYFASDESWKLSDGPITFNCIFDGEYFDNRKYQEGWTLPDFDDSKWKNALFVEKPIGALELNTYPPIRIASSSFPKNVMSLSSKELIYDFGENSTGHISISAKGPKNSTITIRHSEYKKSDGSLDSHTNGNAECKDVFVLSGEGVESFTPKFTYRGFQYASCELSSEDLKIINIKKNIIHSDVKVNGSFVCSDERINNLHQVILRTIKSGLMGLPIDCPQRDERLGWLADAYVVLDTCMYNFDMNLFYEKWLDDIRLECDLETGAVPQIAPRGFYFESSPDWSTGYSIIVLGHYKAYGDKNLLKKHYPYIKRYTDYLLGISHGYMLSHSRYGDWCSPEAGWVRGDPEYTNSLFLYYNIKNLMKIAQILGLQEDLAAYKEIGCEVKEALQGKYFNRQVPCFGDGTQFSDVFALKLGLIPADYIESLLKHLIDNIKENGMHLTTGILGTKFLMDVLCDYNEQEVAWSLICQNDYPSWLNMIEGRTTLPELWSGAGSGNHSMFGSVDSALYRIVSGISIDCTLDIPIHICPYAPKMLEYARVKHKDINVSWARIGEGLEFSIVIGEDKALYTLHPQYHNYIVTHNGKMITKDKMFVLEAGNHFIKLIPKGV